MKSFHEKEFIESFNENENERKKKGSCLKA